MSNRWPYSVTQPGETASGAAGGRDWGQRPSLSAGCRENRFAQPVSLSLAGITDSRRYIPRFFRRQSNGKDHGNALLGQPGPAHFLFHTIAHFCKQKLLDNKLTFVYKSLVSNFGTAACQNNARTPLARLADQRHPARTGAGNERLAMKAQTLQAPNFGGQSRSLAVEAIGDFSHGRIIPRIRIAGQWLEKAGFKPGHRVQVLTQQPGSLTLRFLEQGKEAVP